MSPGMTAEEIWELYPEVLRVEFVKEVKEAMARSDYEGLGAPYDEDAESVATFIAVRAGAFVAQLMSDGQAPPVKE